MSVETIRTTDIRHSPRQLQIDFLFLDLAKCTRCRATDRSLSEALTVVADVLKAAGIELKVTKVHVATEELARTWRFVSSPTIRVNGADIALELRESSCGSEACTDGCGGQIACRVWVHQGQEYTEPPPELIVDAILRHVYGAPAAWTAAQPYEVPENLQRFFAGKPTSTSATLSVGEVQSAGVPTETGCCSPADQETCCDDSAKAACCDDASEQGCGCR